MLNFISRGAFHLNSNATVSMFNFKTTASAHLFVSLNAWCTCICDFDQSIIDNMLEWSKSWRNMQTQSSYKVHLNRELSDPQCDNLINRGLTLLGLFFFKFVTFLHLNKQIIWGVVLHCTSKLWTRNWP